MTGGAGGCRGRASAHRVRLLVPFFAWCLLLPITVPAEMVPTRVPRSWGMAPRPLGVTSLTDTMPPSNIIVDLIYESPHLWAGTSLGVGVRPLPGNNWTRYGTEDGLGAPEIPALGVLGSGVWAATSHSEVREDRSVPWGDGIYVFDEMIQRWLERSPVYELSGGALVEQAAGPFMLCFDLAEFRGGVVGACFAGGLVLSPDAGMTWKTIFRDATAKADFEEQRFIDLNNRFFSVVVDESVPDSVAIYAGTAYGINKYIFLDSSVKVTGLVFSDLHLDGATLYAATESGLSVTPDRAGSWKTFYGSDGLSSSHVSAVAARGDTIWVGLESADGAEGLGLAWSPNGGEDWTAISPQPVQAVGSGRRTREIMILGDSVWFACGEGGLLRYNGPEGTFTALPAGREVNALLVADDSTRVLAGTDEGIVSLPRAAAGDADWDSIAVGTPTDDLSQRVVALAWQALPCTTDVAALWAVTRDDDTAAGDRDGFGTSTDGGATWSISSRRLPVNDLAFFGCRFYLASDSGLAEGHYLNTDSILFTPTYEIGIGLGSVSRRTRSVATEVGKNLDGNDSLVALWVGSELGLSRSFDGGINWGRTFSNPDPFEYDLFLTFRYTGFNDTTEEFTELSGNFITTLALQETGGKPILWAATQGTGQGRFTNIFTGSAERDGVSFSRDGGTSWSVPLLGHQVWNFAFDGAFEVWAASSQGLLHSSDGGMTWDTTSSFTDPETGATIDSTVEVLGVAVVEDDFAGIDEIWVGTGNGLLILDRDGATRGISRRTVVEGAYAWPLPYSPTAERSGGGLRLHYTALSTGEVTITIYDFANNVVKVLTKGAWRDKGQTYGEIDVWDGRDEDGRTVAVGTYFFVIEYAGGQTDWGKISIIP